MRKPLVSFAVFLLLAVPARAEGQGGFAFSVTEIQVFTVNNVGPLTYTYSSYSDFGTPQDLGDINYDLQANSGWQVEAIILDGTQSGQAADDWDDGSWALTVNGVAINETFGVVIDTDPNPVNRVGATWPVFLNIPWPESASNPDCTIQLTASDA
jgi:hypothetical protein